MSRSWRQLPVAFCGFYWRVFRGFARGRFGMERCGLCPESMRAMASLRWCWRIRLRKTSKKINAKDAKEKRAKVAKEGEDIVVSRQQERADSYQLRPQAALGGPPASWVSVGGCWRAP